MWTNPRYPALKVEAQPPPEQTGEVLAALRRQSRGGPAQELRVVLDEYQGNPFVGVRVWVQDAQSGAWWPTRRGVSVRLGEIEDVVAALIRAGELAGSE